MLRIAQQLLRDLSVTDFEELQRPPLPVHIEVVEGRLTISLVVAFGDEARGQALDQIQSAGFRMRSYTRDSALGWAYLDNITQLEQVDSSIYIDAASVVRPELDVSVPEAFSNPGSAAWPPCAGTGNGVIIGIVDSGVDVTHDSLRWLDGSTRVLRLWDQRATGAAASPANFGYGSEWKCTDIDGYLRSGTPFPFIDRSGHGTAVTGVAAANGLAAPPYQYCGVAGHAVLVVVALNATARALPDAGNVIDAISYIYEVAEESQARAVVNFSQGSRLGSHDGRGDLDHALTELLQQHPEHIVVTSAGNLGDAASHARVMLAPQASEDLEVLVHPFTGPSVSVEIWYDRADSIDIKVIDPTGQSTGQIAGAVGLRNVVLSDTVSVAGNPNVLYVGAAKTLVTITAVVTGGDVTPGTWTIRIHGTHVASGQPLDAWLDSADTPPCFSSHIDPDVTVTIPATAEPVLAVGAYQLSPVIGPLASLSSRGPNRRGQAIRLLVAPGSPITTCAASNRTTKSHTRWSGTSFAAPHVTGAIALMLEIAPHLTRDQVFHCLLGTTRTDADTVAGPGTAWGVGKLDIVAALACADSTPKI